MAMPEACRTKQPSPPTEYTNQAEMSIAVTKSKAQKRENSRILSNGQPSLKVQNVTDRILEHSPVKQN